MKNVFIVFTLVWFVLISNSFSEDFSKGANAYRKGDYETALKVWRPLAEQGDDRAQSNMALMYVKGQGVDQDFIEAFRLYHLAAEQGNAYAQYNLGQMYRKGYHATDGQDYQDVQDYEIAQKWYHLAAKQGNVAAQVHLGMLYAYGLGVIEDKLFAYMWWNSAASRGDKDADANKSLLMESMTSSQIEKAKKLASECEKKNYKGC
tara:strand:- start:344 stop:958 length:615 start_codon:yes stop_codon:yes gene_type:complete